MNRFWDSILGGFASIVDGFRTIFNFGTPIEDYYFLNRNDEEAFQSDFDAIWADWETVIPSECWDGNEKDF